MSKDLPIACSLTGAELPARLAEMAALGRDALIDRRVEGRSARLRFAAGAGAGVRERVDAIAAAESECCAFLTLTVADEPDAVVLRIDAPEGAEAVMVELVDAFSSDAVVA
jgi:hypothetical protein